MVRLRVDSVEVHHHRLAAVLELLRVDSRREAVDLVEVPQELPQLVQVNHR